MAGSLILSEDTKRQILDRLNSLPRPKFLAGRVSMLIEFNCRQDGSIGDVNIETHMRELLTQPKRGC
jgi:hypothetical protein